MNRIGFRLLILTPAESYSVFTYEEELELLAGTVDNI